jgi:hypothetical protein
VENPPHFWRSHLLWLVFGVPDGTAYGHVVYDAFG